MKVLTFLLVGFFYIGIGVGFTILISILVSAIFKETILEEDIGIIIFCWPFVIFIMFICSFELLSKFVYKVIKLIVNQEEQNED